MAERIFLAAGLALLVSLSVGPLLIPLLRSLKFGQSIRQEGPKSHQHKAGTPTIGGLIFIAGITAAVLVIGEKPYSHGLLALLGLTLGFGLVGFVDDFLKVVYRRNLGLRAWQKLLAQMVLAFVFVVVVSRELGRGTVLGIPFTSYGIDLQGSYYILAAIVIVAATNGVNLTDGLDGLAAGCVTLSALGYLLIAWLGVESGFLQGLAVHDSDLAIFAAALGGGCIGFLHFNHFPARVFMGDCGSLALGGALAGLAILTHSELVLILVGGVYVVEALSVILQVLSFQTRGKRIFRMSPLHHHFELVGWKEQKVVAMFWLCAAVCALLGVVAYWPMM